MRTQTIALLLVAVVCCGCRARFHDERKFSLAVGDIQTFIIDPIDVARTLRVTAKSTGGKIDVYVYLEENQEEVERMITLGKGSELMITGRDDTNEVALVAPIPPDKTAIVMVRSASREQAEVELKMAD